MQNRTLGPCLAGINRIPISLVSICIPTVHVFAACNNGDISGGICNNSLVADLTIGQFCSILESCPSSSGLGGTGSGGGGIGGTGTGGGGIGGSGGLGSGGIGGSSIGNGGGIGTSGTGGGSGQVGSLG
jgi:hypothetical protein